MSDNIQRKKIKSGIAIIVILVLCLVITTFALVDVSLEIKNNKFHTGNIKININDRKPVINETDFIFEPGMTVKREFFVKNEGTWSAYYKIYLDEISGDLANVLEVTISDNDKVLYKGLARNMSKENVATIDNALAQNEKKNFEIAFYFPKEKGNEVQNKNMSFRLCADAVQTKNNKGRLFQ